MTGKNAPSRILVLLGSPHRNGTTAALARRFTEGAEESGCAVKMIQCSDLDVRPCMACHGYGCEGPCRIRVGVALPTANGLRLRLDRGETRVGTAAF